MVDTMDGTPGDGAPDDDRPGGAPSGGRRSRRPGAAPWSEGERAERAERAGEGSRSAGSGDGSRPAGSSEAHLTIDELAALSGVPSRTIRFYQSKGTLPPPERRGRVAYYSTDHVERLRVIAELQDRGLRLDAIRDALDEVGRGGRRLSLQAWLGMGDELQAPWSDDRPVVLSENELLERVGNRAGLLAELRRLRLVERQGNSRPATYVVPSAVLLDIGIELGKAGIEPLIAFEASEIMRQRLGKLADELVDFFADHAGEGFGGSGEPEEIARSVDALRPQGMRAVQVIFAHEIERSLRELVERGGAMPQARRGRGGGSGDGAGDGAGDGDGGDGAGDAGGGRAGGGGEAGDPAV